MDGDRPVTLHRNHKAIFINGVGGSEQSSKGHAQKLSQYVYNHGPRTRSRVTAIFNNVSSPWGRDERAFKSLLEVIQIA